MCFFRTNESGDLKECFLQWREEKDQLQGCHDELDDTVPNNEE